MSVPVRIVVMGMTGAGKSTFIKTLIPEAEIAIGEDMNSQTIDPEVFMAFIDGTFYEFVDAPGFGDTRRTDEEVLRCISQYLTTSGDLFHGIIYLHSIAHNRVSGSMMAQIRAFKAICGSSFFSRLIIGTTFWEATTDVSAALAFEQQLFSENGYFEDVIDLGAQTTRVFQTEEACLEAIKLIPHDEPLSLQIQSELEGDAEFNHTSAAAAISPEQYRRQQEHEERMQQEQENAERERLENERLAEEEEGRRAQAYAETERLRLLEVDRLQREYESEQARRREEETQRQYLRDMERRAAEQARQEAVRVSEMKAEIERVAEEQKKAEAERQKREHEQREADLRVLRAEEEEKHKRLRRIEHCRESFWNWHISWYHSSRSCQRRGCNNSIRDGMRCWECGCIICFSCYRRPDIVPHYSPCSYKFSSWNC